MTSFIEQLDESIYLHRHTTCIRNEDAIHVYGILQTQQRPSDPHQWRELSGL